MQIENYKRVKEIVSEIEIINYKISKLYTLDYKLYLRFDQIGSNNDISIPIIDYKHMENYIKNQIILSMKKRLSNLEKELINL